VMTRIWKDAVRHCGEGIDDNPPALTAPGKLRSPPQLR